MKKLASRFTPYIPGLVTGGFVARLALEMTGRPWPWPLIMIPGVFLASVGALLTGRLWTRQFWPLLLLTVYIIWPQRDLSLAIQLLALVGLTSLLSQVRRLEFARFPICQFANFLTFAFSLSFYLATTAPDVLPADSGEFQIVAPLLGVAHPPGYPLYTLLGRLFTLLVPFGTTAYRLNLMSAFLAAATLTLVSAATRHWVQHLTRSIHYKEANPRSALIGGLAAALTLGTATTFWAQSGVANIRMPTIFTAAMAFYALSRHAKTAGKLEIDRWLWLLALALGLGLGHHPSLIFLGVFVLVYLLLVDPRLLVQPRRWWRPLLIVLLTLLPLLYLPLRGTASAPLAPPDLDTWSGFVHHVTAQGFEGDMFAYANAQDLPQRLALLPTLFRFQFNPALLGAAAFGLLLLAWRDRRLLVLLAGGLVLHTFVSITYRAPQTVEYMMPAYLPLAVMVGLTTAWLYSVLGTRYWAFGILAAAILLAGITNGLDHGPSFFTLARDHSTRIAMESILDQAPADAIVLADWHWATPLRYLQWVEGQRPDVEVRYVYPVSGQEYNTTWRDRIQAADGERAMLLTHAYDWPDYTLEPVGAGFMIHRRPYTGPPAEGLTVADTVFGQHGAGVRLVGYRLSDLQPEPGQMIELTLAWQAVGELTVAPSFSARLPAPDGRPLAQDDRYLGTDYAPGEVRFERLALPLYPNIPPGDYPLTLEVYNPGEVSFETWPLQDGSPRLNLTVLSIQPNRSAPTTLHPLDVPFAGGPTLVGVDYDRSVPGALRVYLYWRGPARGGEQVNVEGQTAHLTTLPNGAYQTVVLDLPGETKGRPQLTLTGADGQIREAAGPWGWPLREVCLPAPASTARFVPLGDEMALIGASPDETATFAPGDPLTVRLTFLALKPLLNDNGVSVRLLDQAGTWRAKHDLQPALGAIPTLKWIQGSRVIDPHPLTVPADLTAGTVRAMLVVYENFRGTLLKPMDGRMGEVPLGEWVISDR